MYGAIAFNLLSYIIFPIFMWMVAVAMMFSLYENFLQQFPNPTWMIRMSVPLVMFSSATWARISSVIHLALTLPFIACK